MRMTHDLSVSLSGKDAKRIGAVCGWAPGSYEGKCRDCGAEFTGDKRAMQCLPCGVIALKATLDRRDTFIVDQGLWQTFVDSLPKPQLNPEK